MKKPETLKQALEFYSNPASYERDVFIDSGELAQQALVDLAGIKCSGKIIEALKYYAQPEIYESYDEVQKVPVLEDRGALAAQALKAYHNRFYNFILKFLK